MAMDGYTRFELVNYFDVWFNEEEGWQVNNQCVEFDDVYLSDDLTDKQIAEALVDIGFLVTSDMRRLAIENSGDLIEIYRRKEMMPLASLRLHQG